MSKNLILTGMMGVGKSTVGKGLAERLGYTFIDVDKIIEKKEGTSISTIFKNKGEAYFRTQELKATLKELEKNNSVISLGGGAFINKTIRRIVKSSSISFWLDVSTSLLIKRLSKSKKRPLLFNKNLKKNINKIYFVRKNIYSDSNFRIKCYSLKTDSIVNKIIKLYESSSN